jgi:SAM-dependent methyltransferase
MNRRVGEESQRTYLDKLSNGFFTKYMSGVGLDIGYTGYIKDVEPILPTAIGVDTDYPNYNGVNLPFDNESMDYVYSSHCLEHINTTEWCLKEWYRVIKIGGHIIITVPHQFLYEKRGVLPSRFNGDHKRFYTPSKLLAEIETALIPNTYRVRLLEDGDKGFDYTRGPELHSDGQYEITLVLQKIAAPTWSLAR